MYAIERRANLFQQMCHCSAIQYTVTLPARSLHQICRAGVTPCVLITILQWSFKTMYHLTMFTCFWQCWTLKPCLIYKPNFWIYAHSCNLQDAVSFYSLMQAPYPSGMQHRSHEISTPSDRWWIHQNTSEAFGCFEEEFSLAQCCHHQW